MVQIVISTPAQIKNSDHVKVPPDLWSGYKILISNEKPIAAGIVK